MKILPAIILVLLGIVTGFYLDDEHAQEAIQNIREDSANYKFIDPLLFVKVPEVQAFPEYLPLKKEITEFVQKTTQEGKVTDMSVYFRNLNSSQWISVHPEEKFSPASMLKVVTLISVLRAAESDPSLLTKKIVVTGNDTAPAGSQQRYQPKNPVRSGNAYTVQELIEHLIIESDNVANAVLNNMIGEERVMKTYDDLRIPQPTAEGTFYTSQEYSHLFRALYNGTYLSRPLSEKVLELLSTTTFTQGIVAGVQKGTTVSHKFGVRTIQAIDEKGTANILHELHDCGIVYFPQQPYFVCIMTRGKDLAVLESVIKDTSALVWNFVTTHKK